MNQEAKKVGFSKLLVAIDGSVLATTSGYYGIKELEEKRKEVQQWLDKVKTLAKEQNYNIRTSNR